MSYLDWISDDALKQETSRILDTATTGLMSANDEFTRNVIDPFAILFEMTGFGIETVEQWETTEKARKAQKTLSNAFGLFHQRVLGHVDSWHDLGTGQSADLLCSERKILAEVKNKYNTIKGSDKVKLYDDLYHLVMPIASRYHGYTAYYVEIIPQPKRRLPQVYNQPFTPSGRDTGTARSENPLIRRIDGKSFYHLVTGHQSALSELYQVLPQVIRDVSGESVQVGQFQLMTDYFERAFL